MLTIIIVLVVLAGIYYFGFYKRGKIITISYFEETKNQKGGISLRFPTLKVVHGEKREV